MNIDLNAIIRAAKATDTIITNPLNEWLMAHGDDPVPPEVAQAIMDTMTTPPRDRSLSFSASASGSCPRFQVLQYLGVAEVGAIDPRLQNIFNDGKWRHLRWQTMLLMAGLLDSIEFPLKWRAMRSRGSMDGTGTVPNNHAKRHWRGKEFGFELKGVSAWLFPKIMKDEQIKEEHRNQVARYFLMSGLELYVVIYENKGTNEWFEWVLEPEDKLVQAQRDELALLNDAVDNKRLPPLLPGCKAQIGKVFAECPYGGRGGPCAKAGRWPNIRKGTKP